MDQHHGLHALLIILRLIISLSDILTGFVTPVRDIETAKTKLKEAKCSVTEIMYNACGKNRLDILRVTKRAHVQNY